MAENVQTNNNATVSLTFGILSLLIPFIGLILGIIGIVFSRKADKEIARTSETGKGMALAGLICSIVGLVTQLFIILGIAVFIGFTTEYIVNV